MIKARLIYLLVAAFAAWLLGAVSTVGALPGTIPLFFPPGTPLTLIVVSVFALGFLFFGYATPLAMFFAGMHAGLLAQSTSGFSSYIAVAVASSFIAAYAAIRLGDAVLDDMIGRGNFKSALRISVLVLVIAFAAPLVADYALEAPVVVKNCLSSEECFQQSIAACELAKITSTKYGITLYEEVRGPGGTGCRVYVSATKAKSTDMEIAMADKDMECVVPLGYTGLGGDPRGWTTASYCNGSMAASIKSINGGK